VSPWRVILATMVIFGCGVVTGGLLMRTAIPPAPAAESQLRLPNYTNRAPPLVQFQRPEFLRRMQKQLDVTPAENEQIVKIINDSYERTMVLWKLIAPGLHDETKRVRQEIRQVLTPEQQTKYDDLFKGRPRKGAAAAAQPGPTNQP
jgi:Spy/CpxP family protein refolding chaperone